jgi:hypothetical protein
MHATHATDGSIDTIQTPLSHPGEPMEAFIENVSTIDGVEPEARPEAHCCGALGCRLNEYLAHLRIDGFGERVLCPIHVVELIKREVDHV